ncbi:MAG TPA: hypothetical protein PLL45_09885 [Thermoflexales bacterium]|nr:hypothetical protein [Thermoflexales bacterium]HRA54565.1 hypothetical protein [Thermoflexales bacterium]
MDVSGGFGSVAGPFDPNQGLFSLSVPVIAAGTTYTLTASHDLYLPSQKVITVFPGGTYVQTTPTLLGGDADNSGAISIVDLSCIGSTFGGPGAACGSGNSDVNADGAVNIFDLVMSGANYGQSGPQAWP